MTPPPSVFRKPVAAVLATNPPRLLPDVGLGLTYDDFHWDASHQNLLASRADGTLVMLHYNVAKQRFDPAPSVVQFKKRSGGKLTLNAYNEPFAWAENGRLIAIVEGSTSLELYDRQTGTQRTVIEMERRTKYINAVAFASDGKRLAISTESKDFLNPYSQDMYNDLWVVNVDGSGLRKLGHGSCPNWSPDGKWLLAEAGGMEVRRYDPLTGKSRVLRRAKLEVLENAVYSPDGRSIVMFGPCPEQGKSDDGLFLTDSEGRFLRILMGGRQLGVLSGDIVLSW